MKDNKLHKVTLIIKSLLSFAVLFFSQTLAAGESDFPPNYYDTVASDIAFGYCDYSAQHYLL